MECDVSLHASDIRIDPSIAIYTLLVLNTYSLEYGLPYFSSASEPPCRVTIRR